MGLSYFCDPFFRAWERKKTLFSLAALTLIAFILGACFAFQHAAYDYHAAVCARYLDEAFYAYGSPVLLVLQRFLGYALLAAIFLLAGAHPALLAVPIVLLAARGYLAGGSAAVFVGEYGATGVLVLFTLYLPVKLLSGVVFVVLCTLSFARVAGRNCDLRGLVSDFPAVLFACFLLCIAELLLMYLLFRPIGNIL